MLLLGPLKFELKMIEHKIYWTTVFLHLERVMQMINICQGIINLSKADFNTEYTNIVIRLYDDGLPNSLYHQRLRHTFQSR